MFFDRIGHIAKIGDTDLRSVRIGHHQRLVLFGLEKLVGGAQLPGVAWAGDLALGPVGIGVLQHGGDLVDADVVLVHCVRIEFDAHRGKRAAQHADLPDSIDLGDFLREHR